MPVYSEDPDKDEFFPLIKDFLAKNQEAGRAADPELVP